MSRLAVTVLVAVFLRVFGSDLIALVEAINVFGRLASIVASL